MSWAAASASPAGSTTQVQYNSSGSFAGSANLIFDGSSLSVNGIKIGQGAGSVATNTAIGLGALNSNTTGNQNTIIGYQTANPGNPSRTTAVGYQALYNNLTTGTDNLALGVYAGYSISSGSGNIVLGRTDATGNSIPVFNITTENNRVAVGTTAVTNAYIQVAWTVVSDARDKTDFQPIPHGLSFVQQLNPVSFYFKESRESEVKIGIKRYGFKAQEILALEGDDAVIIDNEDSEKLRYNGEALVPVLVKAIQELTARVAALEAK
jgi:hypothetical protein